MLCGTRKPSQVVSAHLAGWVSSITGQKPAVCVCVSVLTMVAQIIKYRFCVIAESYIEINLLLYWHVSKIEWLKDITEMQKSDDSVNVSWNVISTKENVINVGPKITIFLDYGVNITPEAELSFGNVMSKFVASNDTRYYVTVALIKVTYSTSLYFLNFNWSHCYYHRQRSRAALL